MAKKVPHTEENVLGIIYVNGEWVPYWEDDQPEGSEFRANSIGANMTSMSMCLAPRPSRPSPKPK